jgi:hypothetical protein
MQKQFILGLCGFEEKGHYHTCTGYEYYFYTKEGEGEQAAVS